MNSRSNFKENEQKIEQDFSRLMDRYQRSRQVIDQLYVSNRDQSNTLKSDTMKMPTKEKDGVARDKYEKVRTLNKELKLTLKEYIERTKDLETQLSMKDDLIIKYEKELRDNQENYLRSLEEQKNMNYKEDQNLRQVDEFKQQMAILKSKILKKKNKISTLKETQKCQDTKFEDQKMSFQQELDRVSKLCEDFSLEIKDNEKKNLILKEENDVLKQALAQKDEQLRYFDLEIRDRTSGLDQYQQKHQELQEEKRILQLAFDNQERKVQELVNQQNELDKQLSKKKDKIKQLNQQINNLENKISDQQREEINLNKVIGDQKSENQKYQQLLEDQRNKTDQALKEATYKLQEVKDLKQEIDRQKQNVELLQEKLGKYDIQYQVDQQEKQKLLQDLDLLSENNQRYQQALYDADREIEYQRQQQEQEIMHIEKKVDQLVQELQVAKDEINDWKIKLNEAKKQQLVQEEQTNQYKSKYLKAKQNVKTMEGDIRFMEEKLKLLENERLMEEREALKKNDIKNQQRQVQQSKIRVLDEIQNMIKQHKLRD